MSSPGRCELRSPRSAIQFPCKHTRARPGFSVRLIYQTLSRVSAYPASGGIYLLPSEVLCVNRDSRNPSSSGISRSRLVHPDIRPRNRRSVQGDHVVSPLISGSTVPERTYISASTSCIPPVQTQINALRPARGITQTRSFQASVWPGVAPKET